MHRLTNKDAAAMTADCSECETRVAIRKAGRGWRCVPASKKLLEDWREANPAKAAANRRPEVSHQIIDVDWRTMRGYCTTCDQTVGLVPYGKGRVCANRFQTMTLKEDEEIKDLLVPKDDDAPGGFHVIGLRDNPYEMPEYESAVPGWKTLGKNAPHEPRHAKDRELRSPVRTKPMSLSLGKYQFIDGTLGARP